MQRDYLVNFYISLEKLEKNCDISVTVDGSCAKHLTVESYTVVMLLTFMLIIITKI